MPTTTRGARHLLAALVAAALVAGLCGVAPASAADPGTSGAPPEPVLERDLRGEEAIRALGERLPAVAAQNDLSPAAFRAALRRDPMLWVSRTGQLLFVDELQLDPEPADAAGLLASTTMPAGTDVFALHSRPGAERVIVLDFDGHDARGTAWGSSPRQDAAAYSQDSDPATFDDAERAAIHSVWQRVAEDYAPFAVDVTTQDPGHGPGTTGHESIRRDSTADGGYGTRVVITPTQTYACSCGGVAYVGVFDEIGATHDAYQPAWVFTSGVGTGAKSIAEAASHEAGHNLGLSHDGSGSTGYYEGHGDWAPIMGVGYYQPISQWSRGEYQGANNREDDYALAVANGAPMAADDQAGPVEVALGATVHGTIGAGGDVDSFTFTMDAEGPVRLAARAAAVSPNLDLRMRVVAGSVEHPVDPPLTLSDSRDLAVGLDAVADLTLPAGTHTVLLDGASWGDPLTTGYTTYGSVGRYTLTVGGGDPEPPPPPATPPAAPSGLDATVGGSSVVLSWTDNSGDETAFELQRESRHKSGSYRGTTTISVDASDGTTATKTDSPGSGTFRYRVRAVRGELASGYTDWVVVEVAGGGGGRPPKAR